LKRKAVYVVTAMETKGFLMFRHVVHIFFNGWRDAKELNSFESFTKHPQLQLRIQCANVCRLIAK